MSILDNLTKKELVELIGKCWITHDGMWFYNCLNEFGIEKTNKINKAAIQSMVPLEMERLKKACGFTKEQLRTPAECTEFLRAAAQLFVPDFMNVTFSFERDNVIRWEFNEKGCFAYNGVVMLDAIEKYECGPLFRVKCWLDYLGITYDFFPQFGKCLKHEQGECAGHIKLYQ